MSTDKNARSLTGHWALGTRPFRQGAQKRFRSKTALYNSFALQMQFRILLFDINVRFLFKLVLQNLLNINSISWIDHASISHDHLFFFSHYIKNSHCPTVFVTNRPILACADTTHMNWYSILSWFLLVMWNFFPSH